MTVEVTINNRKFRVDKSATILEACEKAGFDVPTLCREKERERPFTSCFICVVEVEGMNKFVPACGTQVREGMVVHLETEKVFEARRTGLELLLSDHNADCIAPCHWGCPAHADVQGYVNAIANGEFETSIRILRERIPLPNTLGRVCPHPCEGECRRNYVDEPVSIRNLKRFVADWALENGPFMPEVPKETGKKVAIVGGGPAGLSAAFYMRQKGHTVTLYEQMPSLGGMLRYGIPEYRLPKKTLDKEIRTILDMGVNTKMNSKLGEDFTLEELEREYDAVFLAIGAWKSKSLRLEGEDHPSVYGGIDFLREVAMGRPMNLGGKVIIVGGGNTAIDAARTALRVGAQPTILYRRSKLEMPAEEAEIDDAEEEGVQFRFLSSPDRLVFEGNELKGMNCLKMELGEADASGRRRPTPIEGSEFLLEADSVITAIGQDVEPGVLDPKEINCSRWNTVEVQKPIFKTNRPNVFAGGDLVKGPALVVDAVYQGRKAAEAINCMLAGETFPNTPSEVVSTRSSVDESLYEDEPRMERKKPEFLQPKDRKRNFLEVDTGLTVDQAVEEANRCMSCGCQDLFECKLRRYMNDYLADPRRFEGENHDYKVDNSHPFILREPNKCVKCGKCVEICDKARGISVYGFAQRGFEAIVAPTLNKPLIETDCISCGDCVAVCPVGSLTEKVPFKRPGPFETLQTSSTCTRCSVGCAIKVHEINGLLYKITPDDSGWNGFHMCETGRFDYAWVNDARRMLEPTVKVGDGHEDIEWDKALRMVADQMKEQPQIILRPTCTNEEAYLAREIVRKLGGEIYLIVDDHETCDGLQRVLGNAGSTVTFDDIARHDVVLVYNTDIVNRFSPAGVKIRQAAQEGTQVVIAGDQEHRIREAEVIESAGIGFLDALIATASREQLISGTAYDEVAPEIQPLLNDLAVLSREDIEERSQWTYDEISSLVRKLASDRGLLIFGLAKEAESKRLALFKQLTEANMIVLKRGSNSQGVADLGIPRITQDELPELTKKNILMLGYPPENFKRPDTCNFLAIQRTTDPFPTADIIIPRSTPYENDGTSLTTDRRLVTLNKSVNGRWQNWKILTDLAEKLDVGLEFEEISEVTEALIPELKVNRDDR